MKVLAHASVPHVIYYGSTRGLIKIGYTDSGLTERTTAHRKRFPDYTVLYITPGTRGHESALHRMFRHLLAPGEREWFVPAPDLLDHILSGAPLPTANPNRRPDPRRHIQEPHRHYYRREVPWWELPLNELARLPI